MNSGGNPENTLFCDFALDTKSVASFSKVRTGFETRKSRFRAFSENHDSGSIFFLWPDPEFLPEIASKVRSTLNL
jgi:hypothetical protein